jgi:hypothetical protein
MGLLDAHAAVRANLGGAHPDLVAEIGPQDVRGSLEGGGWVSQFGCGIYEFAVRRVYPRERMGLIRNEGGQ